MSEKGNIRVSPFSGEPPENLVENRQLYRLDVIDGEFSDGAEVAMPQEADRSVLAYTDSSSLVFGLQDGVPVPFYYSSDSKSYSLSEISVYDDQNGPEFVPQYFHPTERVHFPHDPGFNNKYFEEVSSISWIYGMNPEFDKSFLGAAQFLKLKVGHFDGDKILDMAYVTEHPAEGTQSLVLYSEGPLDILEEYTGDWTWFFEPFIEYSLTGENRVGIETLEKLSRLTEVLNGLVKGGHDRAVRNLKSRLNVNLDYYVAPEAFRQYVSYVDLVLEYKDHPSILAELDDSPLDCMDYRRGIYLKLRERCLDELWSEFGDGHKVAALLRMYKGLYNDEDWEASQKAIPLLVRIGRELEAREIKALSGALAWSERSQSLKVDGKLSGLLDEISSVMAKSRPEEVYGNLYSIFAQPDDIDLGLLAEYSEMLDANVPPSHRDIKAVEDTIGFAGARLLWKRFNMTRFDRYHPTILKHLVKVASDVDYKKDAPLVLIASATRDWSGAFYWGNNFEYDPRVRVVAFEFDSTSELSDFMIRMKADYGIPDAILLTAHGEIDKMDLGFGNTAKRESTGFLTHKGVYGTIDGKKYSSWALCKDCDERFNEEDREKFRKDLHVDDLDYIEGQLSGIYGDSRPQIVNNSCSTGKEPPEGEINVAQALANLFQAEVHAPEAVEGLLKLEVEIDPEGRARLIPLFVEIDNGPLAINEGGRIFVPQPKGKMTPRDYGGYGVHKAEDRNSDANPVNTAMPDIREGAKKLFRSIFGE